jgi:hypothetical protein
LRLAGCTAFFHGSRPTIRLLPRPAPRPGVPRPGARDERAGLGRELAGSRQGRRVCCVQPPNRRDPRRTSSWASTPWPGTTTPRRSSPRGRHCPFHQGPCLGCRSDRGPQMEQAPPATSWWRLAPARCVSGSAGRLHLRRHLLRGGVWTQRRCFMGGMWHARQRLVWGWHGDMAAHPFWGCRRRGWGCRRGRRHLRACRRSGTSGGDNM